MGSATKIGFFTNLSPLFYLRRVSFNVRHFSESVNRDISDTKDWVPAFAGMTEMYKIRHLGVGWGPVMAL